MLHSIYSLLIPDYKNIFMLMLVSLTVKCDLNTMVPYMDLRFFATGKFLLHALSSIYFNNT